MKKNLHNKFTVLITSLKRSTPQCNKEIQQSFPLKPIYRPQPTNPQPTGPEPMCLEPMGPEPTGPEPTGPVKLQCIGKTHQLVIHALLGGFIPTNMEQIQAAKSIIEKLHEQNLVHADIRIGNIIFCP